MAKSAAIEVYKGYALHSFATAIAILRESDGKWACARRSPDDYHRMTFPTLADAMVWIDAGNPGPNLYWALISMA